MQLMRLALVALLGSALAMFEDQADKIDWCRQNIGRATSALFHSTGNQRLAIVSTEQAVLAALDLRTGAVAWRQVLPDGENVTAIQNNGRALLSLSTATAGAYVRLWSLQGALLWDALIPAKEGKASVAPEAVFIAGSVVVAWGDSVTAFEYGGGDVTWRWHATSGNEDVQLSRLLLQPAAEGAEPTLRALGLTSSSQMLIATLSAKDGTVVGTKSVAAPRGTTGLGPTAAVVATFDAASVALVDGLTLLQHGLGGSAGTFAPTPLQGLLPAMPGIETAELLPLSLPGVLAVRVAAKGGAVGTALLKVSGGGAPALLELLQGDQTLAHASSKEGKVLLAVIAPAEKPVEGGELALRVLQLEAGAGAANGAAASAAWSETEALPYAAAEHGPVAAAWLNAYSRKDGTLGHRLLLSSDDHAVQLVQATPGGGKGVSAWLREEALASVRAGLLLPMPALVAESPDGGAPTFAFALPGLLEGLQRRWADATAVAAAAGKADAAAEPAPRHADAYGTRQLLVLRSAQKVFGLHSSTGELLWSIYVKSSGGGGGGGGAAVVEVKGVFASRDADGGAAKLWALVQDGDKWRVLAISPTDGAVLSDVAEVGDVVHATKLGLPDGGSALVVLVSDRLPGDALGAFVYPDTLATRRAVRAQMGSQFFYLLRASGEFADAPTLQGYGLGLSGGSPGAAVDDAAFEKASPPFAALPRWSLALPAGQVVSSASFPPDAAAGSPVRVLGDRSVLHKYINRNLLAVGLATPPEAEEQSAQVMLVDTVSGAVLHTARHAGCGAPLTMAMGEHWLVYHYWCEAQLQYQATATELYTNSSLTDDPLGLLLSGPVDYTNTANMFDSFSAASARPHALSQSYGFATGLATMGVTLTAAGLTPKSVLAATTAGQLVTLDKRMLDPRRPAIHPSKMTQQQKEEGLVPYAPTLGGINPLSVTTHRHTIARPRAILTAPTTLESTSLSVLLGLDLFLTRVAPAREFDRLNEDFNFFALIGATVFLIVATLGSGWYSKRRDLLAAWK